MPIPSPHRAGRARIRASGSSHDRVLSRTIDRPRDLGAGQRESGENGFEPFPADPSVEMAPTEPATPASGHSVPEVGELFAIARQTVVGAVSLDHAGKAPALIRKRHVPMLLALGPRRLDGPRETRLGGELSHDRPGVPSATCPGDG